LLGGVKPRGGGTRPGYLHLRKREMRSSFFVLGKPERTERGEGFSTIIALREKGLKSVERGKGGGEKRALF